MQQRLDKCTPRQCRQLDFMSQFTTDIQHIKGSDNIRADTLSKISSITMSSPVDYEEISKVQEQNSILANLIKDSQDLQFKKITIRH